ncbi:phospholipase D/nuclease [Aureobasidium subglaciale]|nr:phospholipase D/nuclease [Aureobasidium subglaciale]KAI5224087.1 phospholipase D/nuclease [Aureobasidium subglaciale]KAI5228276.1 phospholipase D/nuclease [Aureobasidium subglaciale]KAI5262853.1 phospholipase D/nuclease [Aureobasidium subglaciale]
MAGIPGLDRRAMEAERLALTNTTKTKASSSKRQRSISPPLVSRPAKKVKEQQNPPGNCHYPRGVIKRTWAFGHARTETDIKIEEVLEKSTLRTALLSAFQWDTNWIMAKLNLQQTKVIMVMQAENEDVQQQYRQITEYLGKILRLVFPSMEGNINCMHSKLMLLFHPHKLRVVVPSANLTSYDWGETGVMENSVFLIDLPRHEPPSSKDESSLPQFGRELLFFLEKMGCDDDIRKGVLNFDFSNTGHLALVHSVGGAHYGEDRERTGYPGLSKAVRELQLSSASSLASLAKLQIDYAASSIGSLTDDFLTVIHNAARGEDATTTPTSISRTAPKPFQNTISTQNIRDLFRIYFPTHATVASSTGGPDNGGTICLASKWWDAATFPRSCFRDYRSKRPGMLSHNKIIYARGRNERGEKVAWRYLGSANLSESAWGKLSWDRKKKEWKLGCRNWECGVIMPVETETHTADDETTEKKMQEVVVLSDDDEDAETDSGEEDAETESEAEDTPQSTAAHASKKDSKAGKTGAIENGAREAAIEKEVPDMDIFNAEDLPFDYPGADYDGRDPWVFRG